MPQDWDKWDRISAHLDAIERRARQMKQLAGEIQNLLTQMDERPAFETEARDRMVTLAQDIATLHAFMKASNEHYIRLPETA